MSGETSPQIVQSSCLCRTTSTFKIEQKKAQKVFCAFPTSLNFHSGSYSLGFILYSKKEGIG